MTKRQRISVAIEAGLLVIIMAGMGVMMGIGFSQARAATDETVMRAFVNIAWLSLLFLFLAFILLAWRVMRLVRTLLAEKSLPKTTTHPDAWAEAGRRFEADQSAKGTGE
jgi:DNA-binding PucR family transcriptional regulator